MDTRKKGKLHEELNETEYKPRMAGAIGKLDSYDSSSEDWATYIERLDQYCVANDIAEGKKVSVLLCAMGAKTYTLLRSLLAPIKPAEKSYAEMVRVLQDHLNPKPLLIAERFRFYKRNQLKKETIAVFVAELRKLAEHCEFGGNLADTLRDRFVCGLDRENIQKRLLTERDLTFQRAIEIASSMETAAKDTVELREQMGQEHHVQKMEWRQQRTSPCFRCGKNSHSR